MNQETWIQLISLVVLVILAIFYNPATADFQGKVIFFGIVLAIVLFLIVFDIYKKLENNEIKIKLFDEKWNLNDRIKKLEEWKNDMGTRLPKNKKGQIDPRIILLIIIIILIYLYLKSKG